MYIGTLTDVINEATIKAPERPVAGVHHYINMRERQNKVTGKSTAQHINDLHNSDNPVHRQMANVIKSGMHRALADKKKTKKLLSDKYKINARPDSRANNELLKSVGM